MRTRTSPAEAPQTVAVTFFESFGASRKTEQMLAIDDLVRLIEQAGAPTKHRLPWLKAARFGDVKTVKGSLRSNENMLAITGIEGDYDGEVMTFEVAVDRLTRAGIAAIVYTSPSYTPDTPRWRVLCFFAEERLPDERELMVARLNGVLGGVLGTESFTRSQAFYYGAVAGNPEHRVVTVEGTPIDQLPALDAAAKGKRANARPETVLHNTEAEELFHQVDPDATVRLDVDGALDLLREGGHGMHPALVSLAGYYLRQGLSEVPTIALLQQAMQAMPRELRTERWRDRFDDIQRIVMDIARKERAKHADNDPDLDPALIGRLLSAKAILAMDIPPPEPLLGSLVTKSTRAFLVGPTGLGKTMLGYSIAAGMTAGQGFLHWQSARPCRVLVFDGEMPGDLVQARLHDALRRAGQATPPDGLFLYSLDLMEQLAKLCPYLGQMAPLCTDEGQRFVMALCGALKVDAVVFDNLMSLLGTAALEPEKWEATLPLVAALTANRIGQLWLDHTNKAGGQFGTGTKAWRFDTVGVMAPLDAADRFGDDVAFTLSFDDPGKSRRRTPANRSDYERVVVRLRGDVWSSELASGAGTLDKVKPSRRVFYEALLSILPAGPALLAETTLEAWRAACLRHGLLEPLDPDAPKTARDSQSAPFRAAKFDLIMAGWITISGTKVVNQRRRMEL